MQPDNRYDRMAREFREDLLRRRARQRWNRASEMFSDSSQPMAHMFQWPLEDRELTRQLRQAEANEFDSVRSNPDLWRQVDRYIRRGSDPREILLDEARLERRPALPSNRNQWRLVPQLSRRIPRSRD